MAYIIVPRYLQGKETDSIPPGHEIQMDIINNRFRLVGPNAGPEKVGRWTRPKGGLYREKEEEKEKRLGFDYYKKNYQIVLARARGYDINITEYQEVPEVAVMRAETQELICLPQSSDENVIGIVGIRGQGKTFLLNSISSRLFWKGRKRLAFINDQYKQTHSLALPCKTQQFVEELKKVNEHPMPMPMVWLYPMTDTFNERNMFCDEVGVAHKISFPFDQAVMDYHNFFAGKKDWDLGRSGPLLRLIAEDLSECDTIEEMNKVIAGAEIDSELEDTWKIPSNSKGKVMRILNDVYRQKILDITTKVPAMWNIRDEKTGDTREYSPITALMACKLVPSLQTRNLSSKHYFPQYMKYILDDIFDAQTRDPYFYQNKISVYLVVDEITNIAATDNKSVAQESLTRTVTEGRPNRIGFVYTTQNYSVIDKKIRENTTHLFSFRLKKETSHIKRDFDLDRWEEDNIKALDKFEVMAMTSDKFIVYDKNGERRESEPDEVFKGKALPPLCEPSAPK